MNHAPAHPIRRRAFTLVELLVVITIFVLLLAIAVPSFSSLIYSSERAQAENQFVTGLTQARSAALTSESSGDTAAVFFFDNNGRLRIVTCVAVGSIPDGTNVDGGPLMRDVFVPLANYPAVQLPRGWSVRGFAPVGAVDTGSDSGWYNQGKGSNRELSATTGNWVFPETAYFDPTRGAEGDNRQTFMIRFQGGTGVLRSDVTTPAVVLDFSPSTSFRTGSPWSEYRFDSTDRPEVLVRRAVARAAADPTFRTGSLPKILGDLATDTVLTRAVSELALYDEKELAGAVGARGLNKATNSLYGGTKANTVPTYPRIDQSLFGSSFNASQLPQLINDWILGVGEQTKPSDVRLYTIDRYSGQAREVLP